MKPIIKITDVESGKELEIVKGDCSECYYYQEFECPEDEEICGSELIFKEVTNKEENENK